MSEQRRRYLSIPLRAHAPALQGRGTGETTANVPRLLPRISQGQPSQETRRQSYVSHQNMPALPDEAEQYAPAFSQRKSSAIRYTDVQGRPVVEQGKKRFVFERGTPPPSRRRVHWLLFVGGGMLLMLLAVMGSQWVITGLQAHSLDATYGYPRTWQTDAVVGHEDSPQHPSHFIFENLRGRIIVIELPGGNITHAKIYSGPTIFAPNADQIPVTGSFADVNHDGRPDMEIHINTQIIVYLNNGNQFVPQVP